MNGSPFAGNELATYWHEDGVIVFFPMGDDRYRLIANLGAAIATEPAPPALGDFQALVDQRGPGGIRLTQPLWMTWFRINERQVADYRSGRVFLAGDAAHIHSPAGGQGMNTGMQDAFNLAWKLAMVARKMANAPRLLDSYNAERRPVGAAVIEAAGRLTKIATVSNRTIQHVRNIVFHLILGLPPVRHVMEDTMTEISIGYPNSPLKGRSSHGPSAGSRITPNDGEPPYGVGHPVFALRAAADEAMALPEGLKRLIEPTIRISDADGGIQLIRPDGYLAMSAPSGDWKSVADYLSRL